MKVGFCSLGCKVNAYETEYAINEFKKRGYEIVSFDDYADVYVVNTCSVTNASDQKSRKMLRSACNKNKNAVVVAMGCYAQVNSKVIEDIDGVSIIIGNKDKNKIVDLVEEYIKDNKKIENIYDLFHTSFEDMYLDKFENHTRAFVKIQDGCNNFCSYCIIPYTRGNVRSKKKENVISEIKALVKNGYKEVVLTGIHTGHYGQDLKEYDFSDLLLELEQIDGLERIRISSIEITELTDKFMDVLKTSKKIVNHIHIPLQSGCDKILKAMNRKYDMQYFINKINQIRSIRKDIAITSDVIVGFPGETEEDFEDTLDVVSKVKFEQVFMFIYSRRVGTPADKMENQIPEEVKHKRFDKLKALVESQIEENNKKYVGTKQKILIEGKSKTNEKVLTGRTDSNKVVNLEASEDLIGKYVNVNIVSEHMWYLKGEINE